MNSRQGTRLDLSHSHGSTPRSTTPAPAGVVAYRHPDATIAPGCGAIVLGL